MGNSIQDRINKQAENSKNDMLWGKPANDILNGRDCSVSANPIRAIWEMVQNARDVSASKSNIVFIRKNDTFVFKHDGMPFTNDTLNALILQTSAKSRNDGDQVGQYGTGFLTTHKFGREFHLSGSLKLVDDAELYYNFPKLVVDRTPNTREGMATSLAHQFEEKDQWRDDLTHRSDKPSTWTVFTYLQPNEIERKNVEEAFEQVPELIPYVLCLNESIISITLQDEIKCQEVVFTHCGKARSGETTKAFWYSNCIKIADTSKSTIDTIYIQTLESKNIVTTKKGTKKTMVTVILPICDDRVYQPSHNIARLFIYLPLVGTECWGINFMLQAPMFTCSTDDRSSLRFIVDGQTENDPATENRRYIQEATEMIFEYIGQYVAGWKDAHYLAPIYFDVKNANKELSDYYKNLKNTWLRQMCDLQIVNVFTKQGVIQKKPSEIYVLDAALSKAIKNDKELLMPFYNVLFNMFNGAVPCADQLVYWNDVFTQWHEGENCYQIKNINNIIDHIACKGLEAVSEDDLLKICKYLKDSEQLSYFDQNILLTENGTLTNKTEGYESVNFGEMFKTSIKVLLPTYTSKFVKAGFTNMIKLTTFSNKEVKDGLSLSTEALQTRIKTIADAAKTAWETSNAVSKIDGLLTIEERNALLNYCRMVIPCNSVAFQANALELICEYYGTIFSFRETIDSDFFEWRGALRTLLSNVFTEFTLLPEVEKNNKKDWIKRMLSCVCGYSEFNGMLQNYRVYLSQNGSFHYCKELKKDSGIPKKMKDIYNIIASTAERKIEIRKDLFDYEFGKVANTDSVLEVILFGNEIMTMIQTSNKYLSEIDTYEHKDLIMDIINNFDNKDDGQIWISAFETIHKDIPSLLAKLVLNKDNREPMIKIMKVKDKMRLNKAAEIINDENLISIWEMGKAAWTEKQNETHDFKKKKELGNYVEEYLRKELSEELSGCELRVDVNDQQGGQDIIVSLNGEPIYYIEVKSRWTSDKSVMMSALQLDRSVEKKGQYSLFAVDMVGFNNENVKEHIYPATMEEFVDRIRVVTRIGEFNDDIQPTKRNPYEQVHIGGDYKAVVPQNLIEKNHINYQKFIDEVLKPKVKEAIKIDE